ncbi:MAG TPA: TIGR02453 family protein [Acidobacteriota bacterium]|jgi:uncharacterized protein (TIGR02453 family)
MSTQRSYFSDEFFRFLRELKNNNNREWFNANKQRYEKEVRDPALQFIADFAPHLKKINKHFLADPRPNGGSLFRIYRDIRFSSDKSPYKTHLGAWFKHERPFDGSAPGFYLHLDPEDCFAAAGLWHPDPKTLNKVRSGILNRTSEWKKIKAGGLKIEGASLKRPPRGFDADHPFIKDLMQTDFVSSIRFTTKEMKNPKFLDQYTESCRKMNPLVAFLTKSVGLPW